MQYFSKKIIRNKLYKPINLTGFFVKFKKLENILSQCGRGVLIGLGAGAAMFGLVMVGETWTSEKPINLGALLAIFAGSLSFVIGLSIRRK